MSIDSETFKLGMRRLAGHVCLVTTIDANGARAGLTATAVCSVSAEPPTLLVCVNRQNSSHSAIRNAGVFAVNVLGLQDLPLANRFASRMSADERFREGLWDKLETGAPILESALVSFDCRVAQAVEVGTHGILFGEIQGLRVRTADSKPLLYSHGAYGGFASAAAAQIPEMLDMPNWGYFVD